MRKQFLLICAFILSLSINAQNKFTVDVWPNGLPNTNGIDYQSEDFAHQNYKPKMFVSLPDSDKATGRVIIILPGGGYGTLNQLNSLWNFRDSLVKRGIAGILLQYRMPRGKYEVPISDAEEAIRIVRRNAVKWHINQNDVGLLGLSAGGHLTTVVATHAYASARPDFQIPIYPDITFRKGIDTKTCQNFLGDDYNNQKVRDEYSSELQVRRHLTPPALIFASYDDATVPLVINEIAYFTALREKCVPASLHIYPSNAHGWIPNVGNFAYSKDFWVNFDSWLNNLFVPKNNALKVACIGNSITEGAGLYNQAVDAYPDQLQRILGTDYNVKNYGISARTMLLKGDLPYMKDFRWPDVQDFQPDVVVIKLGTNDSKKMNWRYGSEFKHDMQLMIDTLKNMKSRPKIFLAFPLPAFNESGNNNPGERTIRDSVIFNEIIPDIKALAEKNKLTIIDLNTPFQGHKYLLQADGIHPNEKGSKQMAEIVAPLIREIGDRR